MPCTNLEFLSSDNVICSKRFLGWAMPRMRGTHLATYWYVPYLQVSYVRADPPPPASSRENRASAFKPDKSATKDGITRAIYRASR